MAIVIAAPAPAQEAGRSDALEAGLRAYRTGDYGAALRYWQPLAQQGDPAAQYNTGRMYARGEGVRRDLAEAYKWFTLSAAGGRSEGERARRAISRAMTPVQLADGMRRVEEWRRRRR